MYTKQNKRLQIDGQLVKYSSIQLFEELVNVFETKKYGKGCQAEKAARSKRLPGRQGSQSNTNKPLPSFFRQKRPFVLICPKYSGLDKSVK